MADKKLETGRLGRLVGITRAGARTGLGLLRSSPAELSAEKAAQVLGQLRGLAAKAGQTLSYVDGVFPESQRETFERALTALQERTPSSPFVEVSALIEEDLGAPVDELFLEFERQPFASASIGQVHRAKLAGGLVVAVKVQHPGIQDAVESDLKNVSVIPELLHAIGPRALNVREVLDNIRTRFREELDYAAEAIHQEFFRKFHEDDPQVRVPAIVWERSAGRVMTSEFVSGHGLGWAVAQAPELREQFARVLWRFVFRSNLIGGRFNADPHPGNFLFHPDGGVTFLDFGCVQPLSIEMRKSARLTHDAALRRDEQAFSAGVTQMMGLRGGRFGEASIRYVRRCFEPLFSSPYHITRDWVADLVRSTQDFKKEMLSRDGSLVPLPAELALLNRLQFGFYSVLARLDVLADYAEEERSFLE